MAQDPQFLIRSATTLLSIIDQQVEQPKQSSNERSVRLLDRIALLFVTKAKEDVSAVSAVLSGSGSILVGCTDSSSDDDTADDTTEVLLVAKNSARVKDSDARKLRGKGDDAKLDGSNSDQEVVREDMSAPLPAMYILPLTFLLSLYRFLLTFY